MIVQDLINECLAHGFAPEIYRTRMFTWTNEACKRLYRFVRMPAGEKRTILTVPAGSDEEDLPQGFVRMLQVLWRDTSGNVRELVSLKPQEAERLAGQQGRPWGYTLFGGKIRTVPIPDTDVDLLLVYRSTSSDLVNENDVLPVPEGWESLVVAYVLWRAYESEDDGEMATYWKNQWDEGVLWLAGDTSFDDRQRQERVGGMMAYGSWWAPLWL